MYKCKVRVTLYNLYPAPDLGWGSNPGHIDRGAMISNFQRVFFYYILIFSKKKKKIVYFVVILSLY